MFVGIVSKNGNLLLNIPLMPDGTLDVESENMLSEIGKWMAINGEAISGTRPWIIYGEGPTSVKQEYSEEIKERFTSMDFRFTSRGEVLYAICMEWPRGGASITIESLSTERIAEDISDISLLGYEGPVKWERNKKELKIILPEKEPSAYAFAFKIVF